MDQNKAPINNTTNNDNNNDNNNNNRTQHPGENISNTAPTTHLSFIPQSSSITPPPPISTATTTAAPTAPTASSMTSSVPATTPTTLPITTTTTTSSNPPTPPAPAATPAAIPAAPTTATSTTTPSDGIPAAATTVPGRPHEYWCHQCQTEITPMMVPDPMCPTCYNEFVEKIEPNNDPRAFAPPPPPAVPDHLTGGSHYSEDGRGGGGRNPEGSVNLEDLFRLFQAFYAPQRSEAQQQQQHQRQQEMHQQQQQQQQQQQSHTPGDFFTTGTQYIFTSGPSGTTRTVTPLGSGGSIPVHGSQQSDGGYTLGGHSGATTERGADAAGGAGQHPPPGPQWHSPPSFISGLLNRLGIEVHYTTDPAALSGGIGGPMGFGGGFLPMAGNPGDYAWGQRGLDDIITQMMELQNRQHGPVGATDEIINAVPHHTLTDEELEAKTECSVCKDEFAKEDNLLQLPCKHIFHEDCIKPWLKVSGTCPTCRFSLVGGHDGQNAGDHPHGGQNNNSSENDAPSGGDSNVSAGARPATGGFFGFGSAPAASSGPSIPGSFPANSNTTSGNGTQTTGGAQNTNQSLPFEPLD